MKPRLVARLLIVGLLGACAHRPPPVVLAPAPPRPEVTGVWDWVFRTNDEQGNLRVEQEEWHLTQRGSRIEGYYDRALTLLSLDDHLFRCNQQLGFTKFTRVRVAGSIEGAEVRVEEVGFDAKPGPCDDGARLLNQYHGELKDSTMRLEWAQRPGEQTLLRRPHPGGPRLAEMVGLEDRPAGVVDEAYDHRSALPIHGAYAWDLRSVDAEGDERSEHEVWYLDEEGGEVRGYYDRQVLRVREGGTFACNGERRYETRVRFEVAGHRTGDALVLRETGYKVEPGPCDNRLRRLDTYHGSVAASGHELVLSWGSANQVLRRQPDGPPAPPAASPLDRNDPR